MNIFIIFSLEVLSKLLDNQLKSSILNFKFLVLFFSFSWNNLNFLIILYKLTNVNRGILRLSLLQLFLHILKFFIKLFDLIS